MDLSNDTIDFIYGEINDAISEESYDATHDPDYEAELLEDLKYLY